MGDAAGEAGRPNGQRARRRRIGVAPAAAVGIVVLVAAGACSNGSTTATPSGGPSSTGAPSPSGSSTPVGSAPTTGPGTSATPANLTRIASIARAKAVAEGLVVHRVIAEGDVVVVHAERPADAGAPAQAVVAISTFGPDGTLAESAEVAQDVPETTASGHSMFDGAGDPAAAADLAANKAVVQRLYDEVFLGKDVGVIDELVADDEIQHNPRIADGSAGLKALAANGLPVQVDRLVAQGDLVVAVVSYAGVPSVDIFRLADGRIVEHWDVLGTATPR